MKNEQDSKKILNKISGFQAAQDKVSRALAIYSAAIAIGDEILIKSSTQKVQEFGGAVDSIYEMTLQSYLFLGFPRMLTAAECFRELFQDYSIPIEARMNENRYKDWLHDGTLLCQSVYAKNFDKLKKRILFFSPEIFEWMILEGYGKVLSRPGLHIKERELGVIACLMIDERPKQLYSHIRGALNVGVDSNLVSNVINDVSDIFGKSSKVALNFLKNAQNDV